MVAAVEMAVTPDADVAAVAIPNNVIHLIGACALIRSLGSISLSIDLFHPPSDLVIWALAQSGVSRAEVAGYDTIRLSGPMFGGVTVTLFVRREEVRL
jgi:hypothetical protein